MGNFQEISIGTMVRKLREVKGMSQQDLAKSTGLTQQYISKLESDNADPTYSTLQQLATGLGMSVSTMMGMIEKPVEIKLENSQNSQAGYINGDFTLTVQSTLPNEERELYKSTINNLQEIVDTQREAIVLLKKSQMA